MLHYSTELCSTSLNPLRQLLILQATELLVVLSCIRKVEGVAYKEGGRCGIYQKLYGV